MVISLLFSLNEFLRQILVHVVLNILIIFGRGIEKDQ